MVSTAVPSAPVKLTISHIKPKSVQLTWDKSNSDDVLSYIIQYRPYSDESKEFKEISGITKTRGYKVHPLEPYTRYEFRVIAVNKYGRSPPSETVQELTAPQAQRISENPNSVGSGQGYTQATDAEKRNKAAASPADNGGKCQHFEGLPHPT